jgi:methylenetetrahydrofolate--tRNA-(uracil-5-)-methyltransferase
VRTIHIVGGGLAGCEAAWQVARRGFGCVLHEMRPGRPTPAHQTDRLAELVCSNSLKSEQENSAPWLLKQELRRLGSLILRAAAHARVPGGQALTVDREVFAEEVTRAIVSHPRIELRREEVTTLDPSKTCIIASGPLTSGATAMTSVVM